MNWYDSAVAATRPKRVGWIERAAMRHGTKISLRGQIAGIIYLMIMTMTVVVMLTVGAVMGVFR